MNEDPRDPASDEPPGAQPSREWFIRQLVDAGFAEPLVMTFSEPWEDSDLANCYPQVARNLTWRETDSGFAVNKTGFPTPLVVNGTGVLILELANGRYAVAEIIDVVQDAFGLSQAPRAQVTEFLTAASRYGLVLVRREQGDDSDRRGLPKARTSPAFGEREGDEPQRLGHA